MVWHMPNVAKVCEQLAGAATADQPIQPISWCVVTDAAKIPIYLCFFVFGLENIDKVNNT